MVTKHEKERYEERIELEWAAGWTNHISSGTRGSSRRKASKQVYKERGSVRAFLVTGPYFKTSGKVSSVWVSYFSRSFWDQSIYTKIFGDNGDSLTTFSSPIERSMQALLSSTKRRGNVGNGIGGAFELVVSLFTEFDIMLGAHASSSELKLQWSDVAFGMLVSEVVACSTLIPFLSSGESIRLTITCISPLVTVSSHEINETIGVPYGFHPDMMCESLLLRENYKNISESSLANNI